MGMGMGMSMGMMGMGLGMGMGDSFDVNGDNGADVLDASLPFPVYDGGNATGLLSSPDASSSGSPAAVAAAAAAAAADAAAEAAAEAGGWDLLINLGSVHPSNPRE